MKTFNQILSEIYSEPDDSTVTDNGKEYDLNGLLSATLGMEITNFQVKDLVWIFKYDNPWDDTDRVQMADLYAPILVTKEGKRLVVLDGLHRLAKAKELNKPTIQGILVKQELLDKYRIKLNEDAPTSSVGTGNIAGTGVGPQGEPGIKKKFKKKGFKWYGR